MCSPSLSLSPSARDICESLKTGPPLAISGATHREQTERQLVRSRDLRTSLQLETMTLSNKS